MNLKLKKLSSNMMLFTISSFGSKLISFLLVPLYTHYLSTADYGTSDVITTTVSLLIPVLTLNIQDAVLRFSLDKKYDIRRVLNQGLRINLYANIIIIIVLAVLKITNILNLSPIYMVFLYVSFACGALQNSLQMYIKATDRINILVISSLGHTLILCLGNIILLAVYKMGIEGFLIASIVGNLFSVFYMVIAGNIMKQISFEKTNSVLMKEMLKYSFPLVLNAVSWWINSASDRYILTAMAGVEANGLYAVAYKIPTILSTIQTIFYNAWSISAITEFDDRDADGFMGNMYTLYSMLSLIACSGIIIINIPLAKILYSDSFFYAWTFVPFLLVGTLFNGLSLFEGCIFTAIKKTKIVSVSTIVGAAVNTILNFVLIFCFGALGAAFATLAGYFSNWLVRTILLRRYVKLRVNWKVHFAGYAFVLLQSCLATLAVAWYWQASCTGMIFALAGGGLWGLWKNRIKE